MCLRDTGLAPSSAPFISSTISDRDAAEKNATTAINEQTSCTEHYSNTGNESHNLLSDRPRGHINHESVEGVYRFAASFGEEGCCSGRERT